MYLEMARDEVHGGGGWAFSQCVWAPTITRGGNRKWPFWTKILDINRDDLVMHIRGNKREAAFVGYSQAAGFGYETTERPPDPGRWGYAQSFYRANIRGYTALDTPIVLTDVFEQRTVGLESYFNQNSQRRDNRLNLFYTRQRQKLQCLNGAYLSDFSDDLFAIIFDSNWLNSGSTSAPMSVQTGIQLRLLASRIGQDRFSKAIKKLYGYRCCFPGCDVTDDRFLVASHIARWSDNEGLRGALGNGLRLCIVHDKAFELGLFTVGPDLRVFVALGERYATSPPWLVLSQQHGERIAVQHVEPLQEALLEHWIRTGLDPL